MRCQLGAASEVACAASDEAKAKAAFSRGAFEEAVSLFTTAMDVAGRTLPLLLNRAAAHLGAGAYAHATSDAESALALDITSLKAHYRLAKARQGQGKGADNGQQSPERQANT